MSIHTEPNKPVLIDRKHLANRWECSIPTLKRREADGMLKPVYLSTRLVRYRLSDIEAIENQLAI